MTAQTLILPYDRSSPLHIPQRDLVVSAADSISLRVTIVESDDPSAQALTITDGIGGPTCTLIIYPDTQQKYHWDYGALPLCPGTSLWVGTGTVSDAIGSFDIFMPVGRMATWPRRCRWSVLLDWDGGQQAEMIAEGYLHVRPVGRRVLANVPLLTDGGAGVPPVPIVTDVFTLDQSLLDGPSGMP